MIATVHDRFEIKSDRVGISHEPGLVIVIDRSRCSTVPDVGTMLGIATAGGFVQRQIIETKTHGPSGISFFLTGLTTADVSIGASIEWQEEAARAPLVSPA